MTCPTCGSANTEGANFCSTCGARLASAARPIEERKIVTVVFCDLVGSTARAERQDPEDVRAELSSYHARVRSELERHGGTVEKFIGDAVVAVFGAPLVHEDDAERAVRAALAIRDWAREEEGVDVRLAVNTGEALVSVDARADAGEGLVAGDMVNTAARLQGAAPVNGILVGEKTYGLTEPRIEYRPHDAVAAKGKQEPVAVWEVVAARSLFGVDVDLKPVTQLVGRRRELDQLLDSLARARAELEPQLVTIVGVPGMGKSRLVQELSVRIAADPDLIRWRQGRSLPYGKGVSYWALGEMVKAEAGILESDPAEAAESKLRETVARVCSDRDADWLNSMLQPLVGIADASGGDRRAEAFAAWRRFVEGIAAERPTVLVFEDLHWADDGLLDFVDNLVDWATAVPLLVVATARPELLARRPHWGGGKTNSATLSLTPLSEGETAELVHAILERSVLPADVQSAVLASAGGNPLYAEEFARMVAERGELYEGGELHLPDSLQGLISARLDSLTRAEKEVLQDSAVVGKVFWPSALVNAGRDVFAVEESLRPLERKEFVRRERQSSVEGELQYAFRHVLVRDVAYAQIPRATRAERHEQVAAWIEQHVRGEDAAELLAHHYLCALEYSRAAGRETTVLSGRARTAFRDAGRRAIALNAFMNATRFFEAAVELTPEDDPDWPHLVLELAEAAVYVDLSSDRLLLRARDRLTSDVHDAARTEMLLGEYRWLRGDTGGAGEHFEVAEDFAERMTDENAKLRVLANLGRFAMLGDEHERALSLGLPALALAEKLGRDDMRAHVLNNIGVARMSLGEPSGLDDLELSREIARGVGGPEYLRAGGNLASVLTSLGQLKRAGELRREALQISADIGYEEPTRWLQTEIAIDHMLAGEWKEARQLVDEIVPGFDASPFWIEPQTRVCRARMLIAEGAVEEAVAEAERAVELVRDDVFQSQCDPLAFRARLHAELGQTDEAARLLEQVLARWTETHSAYIDVWVVDAWYAAWSTGNEPLLQRAIESAVLMVPWLDAVTLLIERDFDAAARTLEAIGAVTPAAIVRLWAAESLVEEGRSAEAAVQLDLAASFFRSVGASGYLRRCESLLSAAS